MKVIRSQMKITRWLLARAAPEWMVVVALLLLTLLLREAFQIPMQWPAISQLNAVGMGYLVPFAVLCVWVIMPLPLFRQKRAWRQVSGQVIQQLSDAFCLGLVLILHFHIKLWAPLIHPVSYDSIYEVVDRTCFFWMDPLIAWRSHWPQINWINHLYFVFFVWMFSISFVVHNIRGRSEFRRVFLASLLVQAFGAILYVMAPAVGPFIYHTSANAWMGEMEKSFYGVHQGLLAGGNNWLQYNTGPHLFEGLAAFPSLHAGASFVFLYYSWRYCRWLSLLYGPFFVWIIFEAMATRWHYGIDLIAGIALACGSIALSNLWMRVHEQAAGKGLLQAGSTLLVQGLRLEESAVADTSLGEPSSWFE